MVKLIPTKKSDFFGMLALLLIAIGAVLSILNLLPPAGIFYLVILGMAFFLILYQFKLVVSGILYIKSTGLPEKTKIAAWFAELTGIIFLLPGIIGIVSILSGIFIGNLFAFDYYSFIRSVFAFLLIILSFLLRRKGKWAWKFLIMLLFASALIVVPIILSFFEENFRLAITNEPFRLSQLIIFYLFGLLSPLILLFLDRKRHLIFIVEDKTIFKDKEVDKKKLSFLRNLKVFVILIFIFIYLISIFFPDLFVARCSIDEDCPQSPNVEGWDCKSYCEEGKCDWLCRQID